MSVPAFLTPMLVERSFGADIWKLSVNEVFWSLGTILGGLVMFIWGGFGSRLKTMALSSCLFGIFIFLMGMSSRFDVYLIVMTLAGVSMPIFSTANTLLIQECVPDRFLGRIFANYQLLISFSMPAGIIIFGPLGDLVPIEALLLFAGFCIFIIAGFIFKVYCDTRLMK